MVIILQVIKMAIMVRFVMRDLFADKICASHFSWFFVFASVMKSSSFWKKFGRVSASGSMRVEFDSVTYFRTNNNKAHYQKVSGL